MLKDIREPAPELPETFPEPVRAFVATALAKQPEERHPDAPTTAAPPPAPARPAACGTAGDITNVGDGLKVGLASDSTTGGVAAVMGRNTQYGWVHTVPDSWSRFNPCNLDKPNLVEDSNGVSLATFSNSFMMYWTVTPTGSGSYYLKDYMGQSCMTDNGDGRQLTMTTCTPGNKTQEWWIP